MIVFDPGLIGYHGHHAEFARLLKAELALSFDLRFYANIRAQTGLLTTLPAEPACWESPYIETDAFASTARQMTDSYVASLQGISGRDLDSTAVMVIHTASTHQLGALARWYAALPAVRRPKLFLQFQFPLEFRIGPEEWPDAVASARQAVAALAAAGMVRLASNSRLLAERIAQQLGLPCAHMPLPIRWPRCAPSPVSRYEPVFGFFGGLREEKGASLLADALPVFSARHPDARFIIHAPATESARTVVRALGRVPRTQLITRSFRNKDDYFTALRRAGCILLPYDPAAYAVRTSGIFIEAMGLGHLVITAAGTWMAAELGERAEAGLVMPEFTTTALVDCLEHARQRLVDGASMSVPNQQIIDANNPSAFCAAMLRLMEAETP